MLSAGNVAECAGLATLDRCQQAHGKHGKEYRGMQPKAAKISLFRLPGWH